MRRLTLLTAASLLAMLTLSLAPVSSASAQADPPVMTAELMDRLIARALTSTGETILARLISGILGINDGKADMPSREISKTFPDGQYAVNVPLKEGYKDVVLLIRRGNIFEAYLTDRSSVLRAAAIVDLTDPLGIHLITNRQAGEKYRLVLTLLAKEAAAMPPAENAQGTK